MQEDYDIEDNNDEEIELANNDTPPTPTSGVGQIKFTRGEDSSRCGRPSLPESKNRRRRSREMRATGYGGLLQRRDNCCNEIVTTVEGPHSGLRELPWIRYDNVLSAIVGPLQWMTGVRSAFNQARQQLGDTRHSLGSNALEVLVYFRVWIRLERRNQGHDDQDLDEPEDEVIGDILSSGVQ
ncbi:hypothetical protein HAX54_042721 [Datura stramonium]|uniref:Uncharacterized protein n=1 Tax=Datura stramonium TaxID=4076 RepID=A0ABS8SMS0_DATST|nr:hypothetical protein [Datura stramonium]